VKPHHVLAACLEFSAAVDQIHHNPVQAEHKCGIQPRRTGANDHRAAARASRAGHLEGADRWRLNHLAGTLGRLESFTAILGVHHQIGVDDKSETTVLAVATRVHRPARNAASTHTARINPGRAGRALAHLTLRFIEAHLKVEHAPCACGRSRHN
jgi:hypothetical protein